MIQDSGHSPVSTPGGLEIAGVLVNGNRAVASRVFRQVSEGESSGRGAGGVLAGSGNRETAAPLLFFCEGSA